MAVRVEAVGALTPEIHEALGRLLPQLNPRLAVPDAERLKRLLEDPDVVLLVARDGEQIVGIGGIGKTRLALQVAVEVMDAYRDGVWFVPLAALRNWELVRPTIANELEVKEPQTLEGYLRDKQLLLVLDNFEQLLEAAASLATVLSEAAGVKLLVTSRSPLHLSGEQVYPVPPLGGEEARYLPSM